MLVKFEIGPTRLIAVVLFVQTVHVTITIVGSYQSKSLVAAAILFPVGMDVPLALERVGRGLGSFVSAETGEDGLRVEDHDRLVLLLGREVTGDGFACV